MKRRNQYAGRSAQLWFSQEAKEWRTSQQVKPCGRARMEDGSLVEFTHFQLEDGVPGCYWDDGEELGRGVIVEGVYQ